MKNESMYGYPFSSVLYRIFILFTLFIVSLLLGVVVTPLFFILSLLVFPTSFYVLISFKNKFLEIRRKIINDMIEQVELQGDEKILDLGTGSGYAAIPFAKKVRKGVVIGIDKFDLKHKTYYQNFRDKIKINFFGNSMKNAKSNASLEEVQNNVSFIKSDLTKSIPFIDQSFDVILSSQLLYCISSNHLNGVLYEIDRVLSESGSLILFESLSFMNWNIKDVQNFFEKKGYNISIIPLEYLKNKCILVGRKS